VCGVGNNRLFAANGFKWCECIACGTVYKALTEAQYRALNPTYDPGTYLDAASREEIERFLRIDVARRMIRNITRRYVRTDALSGTRRTFLDVGCGMGAYLLAAQREEFEVLGFEPSSNHAHVATSHLNLPVISDYFSLEKVGDRRFDLIMLSHVIEHIYSPKEFLHDLMATLKPGGALIVVTPNSNSLIAKLTGRRWPMLKPVDHVTLICEKAYSHFGLEHHAEVHHWDSEYPYEFAATLASIAKAKLKGRTEMPTAIASPAGNALQPSSLRRLNPAALILKIALMVASVPAYLLAVTTGRRACLNSAVIKLRGPI
jgi:SAM-dependent methyltransferase